MWVSLSLLSSECYFSLKSRGEGRVIWGFSGDSGGEGEGLSLPSWWCQGSVSRGGAGGVSPNGGHCLYVACLLGPFMLVVGRICCLTSLRGLVRNL